MFPAITYRGLERSDFDAAARLLVEAYPYRAHEPPSWERPAPNEQPRRWGGLRRSPAIGPPLAEEMVGYAALWTVENEKFRFDVVVSPRFSRNGIGTGLFDRVVREARALGASTLQARAVATNSDALAFLARRQFVETMRMHRFVLDLTTV